MKNAAPMRAMEAPQDKFRLLFEHSSDPHLIIADGVIADCNDATVRLLGCASKDEVLKMHPAMLSPSTQPDGRYSSEKSEEMDAIAYREGFHRFEWTHRKVDGTAFPVQVTLNAVTLDGRPGMVVVWHDLTELKAKEEALRSAHDKMKRDLEAASAVQQAMLPVSSPFIKGMRAAWSYKPCDDLGGDNLNVFKLDESHAGFYVLDVTGHGLAAALLSVAASHFLSPYSEISFVRSMNRSNRMGFARPAEVAERLNQHFSANPEQVQLFTLLYGILNVETLEFCYACAGHPTPIIAPAKGRPAVSAGDVGYPIGVVQDLSYAEHCIKLKPGDRLYLYSDGITEAKDSGRDLFGVERLLGAVSEAAAMPLTQALDHIVSRTQSWCAPTAPDDDITLLAIEICPLCDGKDSR